MDICGQGDGEEDTVDAEHDTIGVCDGCVPITHSHHSCPLTPPYSHVDQASVAISGLLHSPPC